MKYTIETKCSNPQCDFILKSLPITGNPKTDTGNPKTDMSWMSSITFRFKCPHCQTFFDVIGKEEKFDEKIMLGRGEQGTLFGVSCKISNLNPK
jgi:hypothetical protein